MRWSDVFDDSRNEKLKEEVLDALKPHSDNLKSLLIQSYGALGELPSLKKLDIQELNEVKVMGSEFIGRGIAFPKLESLSITNMRGWEVWSTKSGVVDLRGCGDGLLTSLIHAASSVTKLSLGHITGLGDEVWRGVMDHLGAVKELREGHKLKSLKIEHCKQLLEKDVLLNTH
nr:NB-ARC domains-containing protein [Tanacetum cinerariifolium]